MDHVGDVVGVGDGALTDGKVADDADLVHCVVGVVGFLDLGEE